MNRNSVALLSIVIVFAMLFSFAGCSMVETEEETTTAVESLTQLPTDVTTVTDIDGNVQAYTTYSPEQLNSNTDVLFAYFNEYINKLNDADCKAAITMSQDKSIGKATNDKGEEIPMSDNEYINAAISSLSDLMLNEESGSIAYGDSIDDFLPIQGQPYVSSLTRDDIESATCYFEEAEETGYWVITISLKDPTAETMGKAYEKEDLDAIMKEFDKASDYMSVTTPTDKDLTYKNCQIIIKVDAETNQVVHIEYIKTIDVHVDVTGKGKLAEVGTVPVDFNYSCTTYYDIDTTNPDTITTLADS